MEPQGIWATLGIAPTGDARAIKRAYANASKHCHPEDEPERFRLLHEAYQQALQWARFTQSSPAPPPVPVAPPKEPEPSAFDTLIGEVMAEQEAKYRARVELVMTQLEALYSNKRHREMPHLWRSVAESEAFLSLCCDPAFIAQFVALLQRDPIIPAEVIRVFCPCLPDPVFIEQDSTGALRSLQRILRHARLTAPLEQDARNRRRSRPYRILFFFASVFAFFFCARVQFPGSTLIAYILMMSALLLFVDGLRDISKR